MIDNSFQNQKIAANPEYSVWVSASAGTGKTTVLVSRLLRLFLSDIDPTKILCLTYTNAGAIEMQDRIFKKARHWSVINDKDLESELQNLLKVCDTDEDIDLGELKILKTKARKLFSKLIDNPIPLKIYTIHAFCQSILKRFPIEAEISPHFKVIEDLDSQLLLKESYKKLISKIRNKNDSTAISLLNSFNFLTSNMGESEFQNLVSFIISNREKFAKLMDIYRNLDNVCKSLKAEIFSPFIEATDEFISDEKAYIKYTLSSLPLSDLKEFMKALETSEGKTMQVSFKSLSNFLSLNSMEKRIENFSIYKSIFLTQEDKKAKGFMSTSLKQSSPELYDKMSSEADRIEKSMEFIKCSNIYNMTVAINNLAFELMNIYKLLKNEKGVMDFTDLIETVEHLFRKPNISEWILYKMDGGISHILIDEAQDTSGIQWNIVDILTQEFFTTGRVKKDIKSIFTVGDRKQSIFSFQGANISLFETYKTLFKNRVEEGKFIFKDLPLSRSFRSCKNILNLVDDMINTSTKIKGINLPDEEIIHTPNRSDYDGYVELLPLVKAHKDESTSFLKPPIEVINVSNAKIDLSDIIARKIKDILKNDFISSGINPTTGKFMKRKVEPKDIMILVEKRASTQYLNQKLTEYKIPVSGQDKLNISDNIAIEDLISLIKFTLSPYDDLSLCEVLKSPLFNLNDKDLFDVCYNRFDTVFNSLSKFDKYQDIYNELTDFIKKSRLQTPFVFFDYVLKAKDKRKNFIARFGTIINDVLNEFMQKCLYYDKIKIGKSLTDFYSWFMGSKIEVKRDMEQVNNCIRIMTVHGAKGLESPIVFLFDANLTQSNLKDKILWNNNGLPFYKKTDFQKINENFESLYEYQKSLNLEEYYRLLYVAMTRARDKLYICGWQDGKGEHEKSWYTCIKEILENTPKSQEVIDKILQEKGEEFIDDKILTLGSKDIEGELITMDIVEVSNNENLPSFLANSLPINAGTKDIKTSTGISPLAIDDSKNEDSSLLKGRLIHKLLEKLILIKQENRGAIANKYLDDFNIQDKDIIISKVLNILSNPEFAFMFSDNSFNEIELITKDANLRLDKLVIEDDEVWIIDYKTDIIVPTYDMVHSSYKKQLNTYRDAITPIYSGKKIKTAILWFETSELMEIVE